MSEPFQNDEGSYARDKTGIITLALTYPVEVESGADPYEKLDVWEPAQKPFGLPITDRKGRKRDGAWWDLTLTFEGAKNLEALGATAELDHASVSSPIETFDFFDALVKKYKGTVTDGKFEGFAPKIKDEETGEMIKNPYFGTTHFDEDSIILRVSFGIKEFRPELFGQMSKIWTPLVPFGMGYLKNLPDGQTWRKRKVTGSFRGNVWVFSMESEAGWWKPDLYRSIGDSIPLDAAGGVDSQPQGLDQLA